MIRTMQFVALMAAVALVSPLASAQERGQKMAQDSVTQDSVPLEDEPSRQELALHAMAKSTVHPFARRFVFPQDVVKGRIFGIDVSHHNGTMQWEEVVGKGVRFAYVKATQGAGYHDGQFAANWSALKTLGQSATPVLRGAYHFMSAVDAPEQQAANYLNKVGVLGPSDLPPCLDLESDIQRVYGPGSHDAQGNNIDRWASLGSAEIVRRVKVWLVAVEKATGKKPVIYTSTVWWNARIGSDATLSGYKLWLADYTSASLAKDNPVKVPAKFQWVLWQMTSFGTLGRLGPNGDVDVNIVAPGNNDIASLFR